MELKKVLIIEDDKGIQIIAETGLKDIGGLEVLIAENGKIGLEKMREWNPDLVLMDVMMPVMTGNEVLEIVGKDEELKKYPIVIMTAKSEDELEEKYIGMGALAVIIKPFNPMGITEQVKAIYQDWSAKQ